jgi:hypothetical protein
LKMRRKSWKSIHKMVSRNISNTFKTRYLAEVYSCTRGQFRRKRRLSDRTVLCFIEIKWFRRHFEVTTCCAILFVRLNQAWKSVRKFICTLSKPLLYFCFLRMFWKKWGLLQHWIGTGNVYKRVQCYEVVCSEGTAILSLLVEQMLAITLMRWDWGRVSTMKSNSEALAVYHSNIGLARNWTQWPDIT